MTATSTKFFADYGHSTSSRELPSVNFFCSTWNSLKLQLKTALIIVGDQFLL